MSPKRCPNCKLIKDVSQFYNCRNNNDALQSWCKDCVKKYNRTPIGIYRKLKQNAQQRRNEILNITREDFIVWWYSQQQQCHYCHRTLKEVKNDNKEMHPYAKTRLSIDRKDNSQGYTIDNIVLACYRCNMIKSNYFTEEEMKILGKYFYAKKGQI
jgi:hypothetical protein